jgi:magnesium transporter
MTSLRPRSRLSFFLFEDDWLTLEERASDVWDPIRLRPQKPASRLRTPDVSFLLYALHDPVMVPCSPILENYGDRLEELEREIAKNPTPQLHRRLHSLKRELVMLRPWVWPYARF